MGTWAGLRLAVALGVAGCLRLDGDVGLVLRILAAMPVIQGAKAAPDQVREVCLQGRTPDRTCSAALADVNSDGSLDIVVSNDAPDRKLVT